MDANVSYRARRRQETLLAMEGKAAASPSILDLSTTHREGT